MTAYRRYRVPGGCYFFTVNLLDRQDGSLVERIAILRAAVQRVRATRPFHVDAWVILPDHMHMVWTLPDGDVDFSTRIRLIKHGFSRQLDGGECLSESRTKRRERGIWQRRFWEHVVRDERDYAAHMDYVHFNPVKHGLVAAPGDWPHSTFARCVKKGMYPPAWKGDPAQALEAGERFVSPAYDALAKRNASLRWAKEDALRYANASYDFFRANTPNNRCNTAAPAIDVISA